jgi:hypothetical protein
MDLVSNRENKSSHEADGPPHADSPWPATAAKQKPDVQPSQQSRSPQRSAAAVGFPRERDDLSDDPGKKIQNEPAPAAKDPFDADTDKTDPGEIEKQMLPALGMDEEGRNDPPPFSGRKGTRTAAELTENGRVKKLRDGNERSHTQNQKSGDGAHRVVG